MRQGFRQSMAWLHTWSGLVVGWVLFAVFVTGTASYYRSEISQWMRPELTAVEADPGRSAEQAVAYLKQQMPDAGGWYIALPKPEKPAIGVHWWKTLDGPFHEALLDPRTGAPTAARDTKGGDFLYRFHFELSMPPMLGRYVVGACALVLLVALLSGIVTHRRIFADFFTFRRQARSRQRGWLDAHNVSGVLALPFHLMITYTGLVTLALMYMPWGVQTAYRGDQQAFFAETGQTTAARPALGRPGGLAPVGPMVLQAIATVPEPLASLTVTNPRDANAAVVAVFEEPHGLSHEHPQVAFDGTTGALVEVRNGGLMPASKTFTTMVGLHEAHFAGPVLRLLFFLSGLGGCAMVATGLVLWAVARLPKPGAAPSLGLRLVEGLNVATIVGLPAAVAAFFLANRVLPVDLADRSAWEIRAFFAAWLAVGLIAPFRPRLRVWSEMLAGAAALYVVVCGADALRLLREGLAEGWNGWPAGLGFDAALLAVAGLLSIAARLAGRTAARVPRQEAAREDGARYGLKA